MAVDRKDPHERAKRLARLIISDIVLYNQDKVVEGIKNDTLFQILEVELLEGRKYYDQNVDGFWLGDQGLNDWEIRVYDVAGALKASAMSNGDGKANFWYLPPGTYTVCETQRPGWTNTQPGTTNASFGGNPCYSFALGLRIRFKRCLDCSDGGGRTLEWHKLCHILYTGCCVVGVNLEDLGNK